MGYASGGGIRFALSMSTALVAAPFGGPLQLLPSVGAQHWAVGQDGRDEVFAEQLLRRAPRHRWVRAEALTYAHPDFTRQAPEGVGREQQAVIVAQQRDVPEAVARCGDDAEARDDVAFAQDLPHGIIRCVCHVRHETEDRVPRWRGRQPARYHHGLVFGGPELGVGGPLRQTLQPPDVVAVVVGQEDALEILWPRA